MKTAPTLETKLPVLIGKDCIQTRNSWTYYLKALLSFGWMEEEIK